MNFFNIPPKQLFETLKRDSFKCRFCGVSYSEQTLYVDFIADNINVKDCSSKDLITTCNSCNGGDKGKYITDRKTEKIDQFEDKLNQYCDDVDTLHDRWRQDAEFSDRKALRDIIKAWEQIFFQMKLSNAGIEEFSTLLETYRPEEMLQAIKNLAPNQLASGLSEEEKFFLAKESILRLSDECFNYKHEMNKKGIKEIYALTEKYIDSIKGCKYGELKQKLKHGYEHGISLIQLDRISASAFDRSDLHTKIMMTISQMNRSKR